MGYACFSHRFDIFWADASTNGQMGCYPAHIEFIGQGNMQIKRDALGF